MCSVILDFDLIFSGNLTEVSCLTGGKTTSSKEISHLFLPANHTCQVLGITSYVKIKVYRNVLFPSKLFCALSIPAGILLFFLTHISHNMQPFWGSGLCRDHCFDFSLLSLQCLVSCPYLGIKTEASWLPR